MMSAIPLDQDLVHSILWRKVQDCGEMQMQREIYRNIRVGQREHEFICTYRWLLGSIEDHIDEWRRNRVEQDSMNMIDGGGDRPRSSSQDSRRRFRSQSPGMPGTEKRMPTPPPGCPKRSLLQFLYDREMQILRL